MSHQWSICVARIEYCLKLSLLLSSLNKSLRILLLLLLVFLALIIIILGSILQKFQSPYVLFPSSSLNTTITFQSFQLTDQDCKRYDFERVRHPDDNNVILPIYDFFPFHDEMDMLEIRLYELYPYVTLFLIVESRITLSGKPKPLYLKENWQKFEKYHDKMRRFEVNLDENPKKRWANEAKIRRDGLLLALQNQTKDILLLTSDVDEIPKAHFLRILLACQPPTPFQSLVLVCAYYYYSFEFRRKGGALDGPTVNLVMGNRANRSTYPSGKALRDERFGYQRMPSTCYHCSWCFDRMNLTRSKMASFSHTELNRVEFHRQEHILDRYRHGKDLFDRSDEKYVYIENNDEIPELIKAQRERFAYMFNRATLVNAGFRDVTYDNSTQKQEKMP